VKIAATAPPKIHGRLSFGGATLRNTVRSLVGGFAGTW
jgi:hypothetical protein